MGKGRLEAFSDGVIAVIITIMVLEMKVPHGVDLASLEPVLPVFVSYVLSFVYIGIYWNNHHHMFQIVRYVDGSVLWANLPLLFWLSLYPFTTAWLDDSHVALTPTVVYGVNLLAAAIAYYLLQLRMMRVPQTGPILRDVVGNDLKGKLSPVIYLVGIYLLSWVVHGPGRILERNVGLRVREEVADALYARIATAPLAWHDGHHSGELQHRVHQASKALSDFAQNQFVYLTNVVNFIGPLVAPNFCRSRRPRSRLSTKSVARSSPFSRFSFGIPWSSDVRRSKIGLALRPRSVIIRPLVQ